MMFLGASLNPSEPGQESGVVGRGFPCLVTALSPCHQPQAADSQQLSANSRLEWRLKPLNSPSTATGSGFNGPELLRNPGVFVGRWDGSRRRGGRGAGEGGREVLNTLISPRLSRERKYTEKTGRNSLGSAPVKGLQMLVFFQVEGEKKNSTKYLGVYLERL